jgi:hypothetical protein
MNLYLMLLWHPVDDWLRESIWIRRLQVSATYNVLLSLWRKVPCDKLSSLEAFPCELVPTTVIPVVFHFAQGPT